LGEETGGEEYTVTVAVREAKRNRNDRKMEALIKL
jgi:hypothetical protein